MCRVPVQLVDLGDFGHLVTFSLLIPGALFFEARWHLSLRTKMSGNDGIVTDFRFNHASPPLPAAKDRRVRDLEGWSGSRKRIHRTCISGTREPPAVVPVCVSSAACCRFPVAASRLPPYRDIPHSSLYQNSSESAPSDIIRQPAEPGADLEFRTASEVRILCETTQR